MSLPPGPAGLCILRSSSIPAATKRTRHSRSCTAYKSAVQGKPDSLKELYLWLPRKLATKAYSHCTTCQPCFMRKPLPICRPLCTI